MARPLILALPGQQALAEALTERVPGEAGVLAARSFPDGESYVRLDTSCDGRDVVLAASLSPPDPLVMPLLFTARGARELGARRVLLAAPYLSYLRQDARFHPGEVVTSAIFADFLSRCVDGLVTVDPHLHRYPSLSQIYRIPTRVVHAAEALAGWIARNVADPLLVGPDAESEQWVRDVATRASATTTSVPYVVLEKTRRGDKDVAIRVPPLDRWRNRTPVLVDDIVSTAGTMMTAIGLLRQAGLAPPICVAVHAVFAGDSYEALRRAGAARVVTANSIRHSSNDIDVMPLLAKEVAVLLQEPLEP